MAGKVKTGARETVWVFTFCFDDDTDFAMQLCGTDNPIETLMTVDRVDRQFIQRALNGRTVSSVSFEMKE